MPRHEASIGPVNALVAIVGNRLLVARSILHEAVSGSGIRFTLGGFCKEHGYFRAGSDVGLSPFGRVNLDQPITYETGVSYLIAWKPY